MTHRAAALLLLPLILACTPAAEEQPAMESEMSTDKASDAPAAGSDEWKIQSALSAAPADLAAQATVMDWPAEGSTEMRHLKTGTNGWTCMPDLANTEGPDPMCLDETFVNWAEAWETKTAPSITKIGLAYMLQGDSGGSLTDPYATGPTSASDWVKTGPHVMIVVPNAKELDALPADPGTGGAYVMWKGTPYAHVMMPVKP